MQQQAQQPKRIVRLRGVITRVFSYDIDQVFSAAEMRQDHTGRLIRLRGTVLLGGEGDRVEVEGEWVYDPRFYEQFEVLDFNYLSAPPWLKG